MIQANEEQKLAIEHTGGVSLKAGAGSGKTFVLVEHISYLIEKFIKENSGLEIIDFQKKFSLYISSIVMMTFTKKAAGELAIRLKNKVEKLCQENSNPYWDIVHNHISKMTVGTIHSFCFKLLKAGHFSQVDPEAELINELESLNKVEIIINNWIDNELSTSNLDERIIEDIISNNKRIINSFHKIFSSPELRLYWKKLELNSEIEGDLDHRFKSIAPQIGVDGVFSMEDSLKSLRNDFHDKKWYLLLEGTQNKIKKGFLGNESSLNGLLTLFTEFKGTRGPTKKAPDYALAIWDEFKIFKKFIEDNSSDFLQYYNDKTFCDEWLSALKCIFDYTEENYLNTKGITFSDLEYYVLLGLENPETQKNIQKAYSYLIVDEFQDTSEIQFEILQKLIGDNYNKLFCVGDIKQAIYGFRGGEVSIFKTFDNLAPKSLTLKNNFRSLRNVVEFNNNIFKFIFPLGKNFSGEDFFKVESQDQEVMNEEPGHIITLKPNLSRFDDLSESTLSTSLMSSIEAESIISYLQEIQGEEVCILYKKLTPLKFLVPKLIKNNFSFSAQVKIPFLDDPILGLFKVSLEYLLEKLRGITEDEKYYQIFMMKGYLDILGVEFSKGAIEAALENFCNKEPIIGTINSFNSFLFALGVASANYDNTLLLIESISKFSFDNPELILKKVNSEYERQYSYEFQYGENPTAIKMMTTHASKGLEFDHVILAGVHNNGGSPPSREIFGSLPGSFSWRNKNQSSKLFKTPNFIFEKVLNKSKEFSENKRLLYVACTRAVKSLCWVDIHNEKGPAIRDKDSWINALRKFVDSCNHSIETREIEFCETTIFESKNPGPLFHIDTVGVFQKTDENSWNEEIACFSEISVTRFTTIVDCPRKFYLKNICKLDGDEFDDFGPAPKDRRPNDIDEYDKGSAEDKSLEDIPIIKGDVMQRGTFVHEQIYQALTNNLVINRSVTDKKDLTAINFALEEFKALGNISNIFAEEAIKFPLFGYMLSGTPDLIIKKDEDSYEVWDFKTGFKPPENEESYWFQLYCYGYSLFSRGILERNASINFSLVYVDQKNRVQKSLSLLEIEEQLYSAWKKLNQFNQVNTDHCEKCQFKNICRP